MCLNPNFAEYANGCGGLGIRVVNVENLAKAMRSIFEYDGPAILEIMSDVKLI